MKIFHTATGAGVGLDGTYEILFSNLRPAGETVSGTFSLQTNESVVLRKVG